MQLSRWSLAAGLFISIGELVRLNYHQLSLGPGCDDCFFPYGEPLTFFREGGFAGGGGIVWTGLIGDLFAGFAGAIVIAWLLDWLWKHTRPIHRS
jgi:hypothetical protein